MKEVAEKYEMLHFPGFQQRVESLEICRRRSARHRLPKRAERGCLAEVRIGDAEELSFGPVQRTSRKQVDGGIDNFDRELSFHDQNPWRARGILMRVFRERFATSFTSGKGSLNAFCSRMLSGG